MGKGEECVGDKFLGDFHRYFTNFTDFLAGTWLIHAIMPVWKTLYIGMIRN
jgi:hypothetical protein